MSNALPCGYCFYDFCRVHETLRCTLAMELGVTGPEFQPECREKQGRNAMRRRPGGDCCGAIGVKRAGERASSLDALLRAIDEAT